MATYDATVEFNEGATGFELTVRARTAREARRLVVARVRKMFPGESDFTVALVRR